MVHCLALCDRWVRSRKVMEVHLAMPAEAGSYNFARSCLQSTLSAVALESMVAWAMEMDSEEFGFWHGRS